MVGGPAGGTVEPCHNQGLPESAPPTEPPTSSPVAAGGPPSPWARNAVIVPLIVMVICGYASTALLGALVDKHPLWLIGLTSSNRNLVLANRYLDVVPYYAVGTLRLLAPDPLFYLLGVWYGDAAVRWMERRTPTYGELLRSGERLFGKAGYPLVFVAPNNPVCLFAGAAGMNVAAFAVLDVTGTVTRLWVLRAVGNVFDRPLNAVRSFITDHRPIVIALSVLLVGFTIWSERRRGRDQAGSLAHLDEELAQETTPADAPSQISRRPRP